MSRRDLAGPEDRAALQASCVASPSPGAWAASPSCWWPCSASIASGLGRGPDDPVLLATVGLLAVGWLLVAVGIVKQSRYRRRRVRDEPRP